MSPVQEHPQSALLGCGRTEGVSLSRSTWSFWTELVRSQLPPLHLLAVRVSCWCTLALKDNIWALYHTFACKCDLALQKELVKSCSVLHTIEVGGEEILVRNESGHRLSGAGKVLMGSSARSL